MIIKNQREFDEAKKKLAKLVDRHQYEQMLAPGVKLVPTTELLYLAAAIEKYEKEGPPPEEKKAFSPFGGTRNYGASYASANLANEDEFIGFDDSLVPEHMDLDLDFEII